MKIHVSKTAKWRIVIFLTLAISIFVVCQKEYRRAYNKSYELYYAVTQYPYILKSIENYNWIKNRDNSERFFIMDRYWLRKKMLKCYLTLFCLSHKMELKKYKSRESLDILNSKDLVDLIEEARKISDEE